MIDEPNISLFSGTFDRGEGPCGQYSAQMWKGLGALGQSGCTPPSLAMLSPFLWLERGRRLGYSVEGKYTESDEEEDKWE